MTNDKDSAVFEPCPFCGETMFLMCAQVFATNISWWQVECGCGTSHACEQTEAEAIAAWNTRQPTQSDEWEVLAVGYQALSGKAYHMSDCATCCAPAEKPSPCDCDAPTQSDALREKIKDIKEAWDWWQVDTHDRCASVVEDAIDAALQEQSK